MILSGQQIIAGEPVAGDGKAFTAIDPASNQALAPDYFSASTAQLERACDQADSAFEPFRQTTPEERAVLLEAIAGEIEALGEALISRTMAETGLPQARIEGERGRTTGQLRLFATLLREGRVFEPVVDAPLPEREPLPRPELRRVARPLGPVAVFGASNFPLAFSVAGGDTASALAAGCPVIVKAHPAHPGTGEYVGYAISKAIIDCGLPGGVFSLLFDAGHDIGAALVQQPLIKAVGFTGSRRGGLALQQLAMGRPEPIPCHAEMGSVNPVFLLEQSLARNPAAKAEAFAASLQMGAGQFCTNPGLVVAVDSPALDSFCDALTQIIEKAAAQTMLTPGIHMAYNKAEAARAGLAGVARLAQGPDIGATNSCRPSVFVCDATLFLETPKLHEEIFGASGLLLKCRDTAQMLAVAQALEGQLTATLHVDEQDDWQLARQLLDRLELKAGRVLFNGWPTGVEVSAAMMHGGPYPATTDSRATSVGTAAIQRWLRPVCYQNLPAVLRERE